MENGLKLRFHFLFIVIYGLSLRDTAWCLESTDLRKRFSDCTYTQVQDQCGLVLSSVQRVKGEQESGIGSKFAQSLRLVSEYLGANNLLWWDL